MTQVTDGPRDGLIAEYRFAGDARDTSGGAHHGVVHGAALTTDRFGRANHAYRFDGVDDYIEITPPPVLSPDSLSVSVWVCCAPRDMQGWTNCIVAQDDGNDDDQSRRVFQLSVDNGRIVWHRMIGARDPVARRRVRPDRWYHVVAVHDRGENRLYVDGVVQDTVTHALWTHDTQPLHIGRKGTTEPHFFFKGAIDDVLLINRALGDADVDQLLHEGDWTPPVDDAPSEVPLTRDPLSGRWGMDGVAFLDLRYDGDGLIAGEIMHGTPSHMVRIVTGTFRRAVAELTLDGVAPDRCTGEMMPWHIDGTLHDGELAVMATIGDFAGNFVFTRRGSWPRFTRRSVRSLYGAVVFRWRELRYCGALPTGGV